MGSKNQLANLLKKRRKKKEEEEEKKPLRNWLHRNRKDYRQSDRHWNYYIGKIGEGSLKSRLRILNIWRRMAREGRN